MSTSFFLVPTTVYLFMVVKLDIGNNDVSRNSQLQIH